MALWLHPLLPMVIITDLEGPCCPNKSPPDALWLHPLAPIAIITDLEGPSCPNKSLPRCPVAPPIGPASDYHRPRRTILPEQEPPSRARLTTAAWWGLAQQGWAYYSSLVGISTAGLAPWKITPIGPPPPLLLCPCRSTQDFLLRFSRASRAPLGRSRAPPSVPVAPPKASRPAQDRPRSP